MGSSSSCYPIRESTIHEPYDTKRLLSELITVQTAIVLTDEITDEITNYKGGFGSRSATNPRRISREYTITTSLTVPAIAITQCQRETRQDPMTPTGLEFQGEALMDILTTHFNHRVDVVKQDGGFMPTTQEISESTPVITEMHNSCIN